MTPDVDWFALAPTLALLAGGAVALLGAVPVPIVHFYGQKEVGFILRQSGARLLLCRIDHAARQGVKQ